jgi:hypothetical protein
LTASLKTFRVPVQQAVNFQTISSNTSVTLNMSLGNVQQVACGGTGNFVLRLAPSNLKSGEEMTFIFVQNGTAACQIVYPSTMHNGTAPSLTPNSVNMQKFVVSNHGTDLYAEGAAIACTASCGTP